MLYRRTDQLCLTVWTESSGRESHLKSSDANRTRYLIPTVLVRCGSRLADRLDLPALLAADAERAAVSEGADHPGLSQPSGRRCGRDRRSESLHRHASAERGGAVRAVDLDHRRDRRGAADTGGGLCALRRWVVLLVLPALLFPIIFLVDLQFWMANFGQNLDPTAPLSSSVDPFVPPVLFEGKIAQFSTVAGPDIGLWLAIRRIGPDSGRALLPPPRVQAAGRRPAGDSMTKYARTQSGAASAERSSRCCRCVVAGVIVVAPVALPDTAELSTCTRALRLQRSPATPSSCRRYLRWPACHRRSR